MTDLIRARHTVSGKIAEVPRDIFEHSVLGAYLEEVGPDAKPYLPEMHRVSLPQNPTDDQIAVALSVGVIDEDEAKRLRKASEPVEDEPTIVGYVETNNDKDES